MWFRLKALYIFVVFSVVCYLFFEDPNLYREPRTEYQKQVPLRVTIINSRIFHTEVMAPLIYAFLRNYNVQLEVTSKSISGMPVILEEFHKTLGRKISFVDEKDQKIPKERLEGGHLIVSTSCDWDVMSWKHLWNMYLKENNTRLICVMHLGKTFLNNSTREANLRKWMETKRLILMTIAPHVLHFVRNTVIKALNDHVGHDGYSRVPLRWFSPTFPITNFQRRTDRLQIVIPGSINSFRRSYDLPFEAVYKVNTKYPTREKFHLALVGRGVIEIPTQVKEWVSIHNEFDFLDYFGFISESMGIYPALTRDDYFISQSSGSLGSALVSEVPFIAEQKFLDIYPFLSTDHVWVIKNNQTLSEVLENILLTPNYRLEIDRKRSNMKALNKRLIAENIFLFHEMAGLWNGKHVPQME
eukprot:TRINITY_DN11081_c0_g1_i3.p1 TRINITY_DN11081_c0_g1~~TRINITY_DN11081_c0_g1_i3.p1  ORF type:complete len:414 (-),score=60.25 TRINITY_DN11081_c0_g1_i3:33-1274(-)